MRTSDEGFCHHENAHLTMAVVFVKKSLKPKIDIRIVYDSINTLI